MTLVVAKKKGSVLGLVSDTGIEFHGQQLAVNQHLPKIAILNTQLAVAFAGSSELALAAIAAAPKQASATYAEVTRHFFKAHQSNEKAVDFIVAFGAPLYKFAKVAEGTIRQNRSVEWIGDHSGFRAFQDFREKRSDPSIPFITPMLHTGRESEMKSPCFDMIGTMRDVIGRNTIRAVFGHPVAVSNVDGAFEFSSYGVFLEENRSFKLPAGSTPLQVVGQIREAQQYSFSCFVSSPGDSMRAVAFHYLHGKVTYIYFGPQWDALTNFVRLDGMNVLDLQQYATEQLGIHWIGAVNSRTGVPADYGVPESQWTIMQPNATN
jgi:hypothetical protein